VLAVAVPKAPLARFSAVFEAVALDAAVAAFPVELLLGVWGGTLLRLTQDWCLTRFLLLRLAALRYPSQLRLQLLDGLGKGCKRCI
jgi:hypothetical protein